MTDNDQPTLAATADTGTGIVALDTPSSELADIFGGNLDGLEITPGDLTRIKIPGSGGKFWQWESADGPQSAATITGVIVHKQTTRGWWATDLDESGEAPPACSSKDSVTATIRHDEIPASYKGPLPTGECATCPLAVFDEAQGRTPCQQRISLYLLPGDEFLPVLVDLPTTSIKPMRQFLLRLASGRRPYNAVVVELGLVQRKSAGGVNYSLVNPKVVKPLDPAAVAKVRAFVDTVLPTLDAPRQEAA